MKKVILLLLFLTVANFPQTVKFNIGDNVLPSHKKHLNFFKKFMEDESSITLTPSGSDSSVVYTGENKVTGFPAGIYDISIKYYGKSIYELKCVNIPEWAELTYYLAQEQLEYKDKEYLRGEIAGLRSYFSRYVNCLVGEYENGNYTNLKLAEVSADELVKYLSLNNNIWRIEEDRFPELNEILRKSFNYVFLEEHGFVNPYKCSKISYKDMAINSKKTKNMLGNAVCVFPDEVEDEIDKGEMKSVVIEITKRNGDKRLKYMKGGKYPGYSVVEKLEPGEYSVSMIYGNTNAKYPHQQFVTIDFDIKEKRNNYIYTELDYVTQYKSFDIVKLKSDEMVPVIFKIVNAKVLDDAYESRKYIYLGFLDKNDLITSPRIWNSQDKKNLKLFTEFLPLNEKDDVKLLDERFGE